uniref:Uncharacterized protein n=1 Tax=Daphnia magna TaxID=35525 RepID=A0A0N8AVJ3_9CRUS
MIISLGQVTFRDTSQICFLTVRFTQYICHLVTEMNRKACFADCLQQLLLPWCNQHENCVSLLADMLVY